TPLWAGCVHVSARIARGEPAPIDLVLAGFQRYTHVVVAGMPSVLVAGVLSLITVMTSPQAPGVAAPLGVTLLGGLFSIVIVAAFMAFYPRISLAPVLAADSRIGNLSGLDALTRCLNMTAPFAVSLIGLHLLAGVIMFGSILLLCIGVVLVGI